MFSTSHFMSKDLASSSEVEWLAQPSQTILNRSYPKSLGTVRPRESGHILKEIYEIHVI